MNKNILSWLIIVLTFCIISSCKEDDENIMTTDCYISSFTLGYVKRQINTKTTSGKDTTYMVSYNAAYYPMAIDQLAGTIENKDSLMTNSVVDAMLVSIESSGTVVYRKADEIDGWRDFSISDSIDFTTPLVFRVYTSDWSLWRDYAMKLNVHQQDGDAFVWNKLSESTAWSTAETLKVLSWNDEIWVYAQKEGNVCAYVNEKNGMPTWNECVLNGCSLGDISTIVPFQNRLYMNTTNGGVLVSDDGRDWMSVEMEQNVKLLSADNTTLYALSEQGFWSSIDGETWVREAGDSDLEYLPSRNISAVSFLQENGVERTIVLGNRDILLYPGDKVSMVWSRRDVPNWTYFNDSPDNRFTCPRMASSALIHYNDELLLFGQREQSAEGQVLVSIDNGITWKTNSRYSFPINVVKQNLIYGVAVDSDNYIWFVTNDEVWKGRLNKFGFAHR